MSKTGCIISHEGIEYLCGLIRDINGLDTNLIDDINIKSNGTFSSVRINTLLTALKTDCNDYTDSLVSNISRLELKIVTDEADIVDSNILYLHKPTGQTSYNQYVVIEGNKVLLGTTDINMTDYYTITQADNKFVLKTDFDALKTEVDKVKTTLGADSLNTTSQTVTGAINELNDKSTMVTLTQAEYNQLVADGTVDNDTYYIISDDSENIEITQTISSSSTKNEVPSAKAVYDKTKNMCTTTVADVGKTNITSRVSNATVNSGGGIYYSIKNGICYIQIHSVVTTVNSNGKNILPNGSVPILDLNLTNGHYTVSSPNSTNGLLVINSTGGAIYYGNAMTIFSSLSYPVKES